MTQKVKNVKLVVLGDIGRSPRMEYHSLSLAEAGHKVDFIGYGETEPLDTIKLHPQIFHHYLMPLPQVPIKLLNYAFKTVAQAINLLFLLFITTRADVMLVQNPPAIPSLVVCWIYARIIGAKLIIDWHNYAHTIMALSTHKSHILVRITKALEAFIGRRADYNFCVTKAMKASLKGNWRIDAALLYDKPPSMFHTISSAERTKFLDRFCMEHNIDWDMNKTGLLVSSTSWTEDEDFSVLLSALQEYEEHCKSGNTRKLPKLLCAITGKGPLKDYYTDRILSFDWDFVKIITPWLESSDYPLLLASADLGVSLHTSSSGLDLPMKVIDMFGCGLPVCAYDFKCLDELVNHDVNSYKFNSPQELSNQIIQWFENFPNNPQQKETKDRFKYELEAFQSVRWEENWDIVASHCFTCT